MEVEQNFAVLRDKSNRVAHNLLTMALSEIAWSRRIFPTECFASRVVGGIELHILKTRDVTTAPAVSLFLSLLRGPVFDALDRGHLCAVELRVSRAEPPGGLSLRAGQRVVLTCSSSP